MVQEVNQQNVRAVIKHLSRFLPMLSSTQQELLEMVVPIHEQGKKLVDSLSLLETSARVMIAENKEQELTDLVVREAEESKQIIGKLIPELAELRESHSELMDKFKQQESVVKVQKTGLTDSSIGLLERYERARDFHFFYLKEDIADLIKELSALNRLLENGLIFQGKLWNGYHQIDENYRKKLITGFTNLLKIIEAIGKEIDDLVDENEKYSTALLQAF